MVEISGWRRGECVQRERGGISVRWESMTTESSGQNHRAAAEPEFPSFLSVLTMLPCRCMGFNYIGHIVQLKVKVDQGPLFHHFILKLSHWDNNIVPSLLLSSVLLNKKKEKKDCTVCIPAWAGSCVMHLLGLRANVCKPGRVGRYTCGQVDNSLCGGISNKVFMI